MCVCKFIYIYLYLFIYICVCVYIYIERERRDFVYGFYYSLVILVSTMSTTCGSSLRVQGRLTGSCKLFSDGPGCRHVSEQSQTLSPKPYRNPKPLHLKPLRHTAGRKLLHSFGRSTTAHDSTSVALSGFRVSGFRDGSGFQRLSTVSEKV